MPNSLTDPAVAVAFAASRKPSTRTVIVNGTPRKISTPFPSPADWRDVPIYFLLVDRFNNPTAPPRFPPYDGEDDRLQGGTLNGVRDKIPYLKDLGVGAIWLSPILKNSPHLPNFYGGYVIQDFLTVEPRFTSNPAAAANDPSIGRRELRDLVDTAHAHGLHVIFDIVLNHAGDVFNYEGQRDDAPWRGHPNPEYTIFWRDQSGNANGNWTDIASVPRPLHPDAAVWPAELQRNDFFRRRGANGPDNQGDFWKFKELVTEYRTPDGRYPVRDILIKACQYLIADYDVDGFRIDTLMYVEREFARTFGNAMREFALSIGKRNFFTFGEVWAEHEQADELISHFIGRNTSDHDEFVGVDAALDFPIFRRLRDVCKGSLAPAALARYYEQRQAVLRHTVSSHGDASRYFVTFLDNHDLNDRFYYQDPAAPARYDRQCTLALACLLCLQGVPCLYYGNEQGLHGSGSRREAAREALWGKPNPFDTSHPFYNCLQQLLQVRAQQPPLRYGRQYFRPVSGDAANFNLSTFPGGILAFSRILSDRETLLVANTSTTSPWTGHVLVDPTLNPPASTLDLLFSNHPAPQPHHPSPSPTRAVEVSLHPMEVQILGHNR